MNNHENNQAGCAIWAYAMVLLMLASPVIMLIRVIASAPTPEHRAIVEAQAPNPVADWVVIGLCMMFLAFTLLVVLLKSGPVEYDPPAAELPDALWMAAHTNLTTSIPMGEVTRDIRRGMAYLEVNNPSPTESSPLACAKTAENAPARTVKSGEAGDR